MLTMTHLAVIAETNKRLDFTDIVCVSTAEQQLSEVDKTGNSGT